MIISEYYRMSSCATAALWSKRSVLSIHLKYSFLVSSNLNHLILLRKSYKIIRHYSDDSIIAGSRAGYRENYFGDF